MTPHPPSTFSNILVFVGVVLFVASKAESPQENEMKDGISELLPEFVSFYEGENFTLSCDTSSAAEPKSSFAWSVDGIKVTSSERRDVKPSSLTVVSATAADSGEYVCERSTAAAAAAETAANSNSSTPVSLYRVIVKGKKVEVKLDENEEIMAEEPYDKVNLKVIQAEHVQLKSHVLSRLDGVESESGKAQQKTSVRFRELENRLANLQKTIDSMQTKLVDRFETMADEAAGGGGGGLDGKDDVAQLRLVDGHFVSEFVWIVAEFDAALKLSATNDSVVLRSDLFYSHKPGYRMQLTLYPNYRKSNFTALFAGLVPGEYDDKVPWPFKHDFRLEMVSHRPNVFNDAATVRLSVSNCGKEAFSRPKSLHSPGCGFREFVSRKKLDKLKEAFILNSSVVVRVTIYTAQ